MRRITIALVSAAALVTWVSPALAAKPANQACLGSDVAGYAQGGSGFGAFVSGAASSTQGFGGEVQAHLAGQVPDTVLPNTCND